MDNLKASLEIKRIIITKLQKNGGHDDNEGRGMLLALYIDSLGCESTSLLTDKLVRY
jgi:hypothetical protein